MRVYGSSPLYNYVELIFRSKRLFIISVVLATLVTVGLVVMRSSTYTATALVLMSGSEATGPQTIEKEDKALKGTIAFKLQVLNAITRDPEFFKEAFTEAGFKRKMSDEAFDEFCKEARKQLTYKSGPNILEISCRWKDAQAADIIRAFYSAYANRVLNQETVNSQNQAKLLKMLLTDYTAKDQDLKQKLATYRKENTDKPLTDPTQAQNNYSAAKAGVEQMENNLTMLRQQLSTTQQQLAKTPKTIIDQEVLKTAVTSPQYGLLTQKEADLETKLTDAKVRYTETHPEVKKLTAQLDDVKKQIALMDKSAAGKPDPGKRATASVIPNPKHQQLSAEYDRLETAVRGFDASLVRQRTKTAELKQIAKETPERLLAYEELSRKATLYNSLRTNLESRLEASEMQAKQDEALHRTEMSMIVDPQAEPDTVAAKSLIFYAAGPILGLIIAFAFSLLSETLDHSLRTPIEVEKHLGKPVLAVLPRMDTPKEARRRLGGGGGGAQPTLPSS